MERRKHEVPCQRRPNGDLRRLAVADLAHHDDVRVLAELGAQHTCKRESDVGPHARLAHPRELVLDGVLDGEQVGLGAVEMLKRRVERRRLAAARGAGDEHQPMRALDGLEKFALPGRRHPQRCKVERQVGAVEQAEHGLFAVARRQRRDAYVDGAWG